MTYMKLLEAARKKGFSVERAHCFASFVKGYSVAAPFWKGREIEHLFELFEKCVPK